MKDNTFSELKLSREEMQALGYRVVDMLVAHFDALPGLPVTRKAGRSSLEKRLRESVPEKGMDMDRVLSTLQDEVFDNIMHLDHPRFFGYVSSPSNFVSVMADTLAAGFNVFAGTWMEASGPAMIELITIDWLCQLCGMPASSGGLFVSGGSVANLTALAVARNQQLREGVDHGVVYVSDQTHSSIERAMKILGFTKDVLSIIPSDENFRLSTGELENAVKTHRQEGKNPFCVVATAGSTNTGAVDPLPEIAELCRRENLWLHVDGAYGAPAIITEKGQALLTGLGEADSITIDPHKWMFQPYEASCILVKDFKALKEMFHILPEYLKDLQGEEEEINFYDYGIQLSRSFKALKLWMSIKIFGLENFREAVNKGMALAELAGQIVEELPDWELVTTPQLGMLNFRYVPPGYSAEVLETVNRNLVAEMSKDGFALLSSTVLKGSTVLHMCTINPRTTEDDIVQTIRRLDRMAKCQ